MRGWILAIFLLSAPAARAQAPDYARASELYRSATDAMDAGRYDDAARDFAQAYEITKDPVLFFKIASAKEKGGDCAGAVIYYRRYLNEARPDAAFTALATEHLQACGGEPSPSAAPAPAPAPAPVAVPAPDPVAAPAPSSSEPEARSLKPEASRNAAWLMVGGALAFVTTGAVLAYSASSSEQDIRDLYVGLTPAAPPVFDGKTAQRYQELVDEGHRYQTLSWASFGIAAAFTGVAAYLFLRDGDRVEVAPVVTPTTTGASVSLRF